LVYEQAAIARQLTLAAGARCRRCGSELELEESTTRAAMEAVPPVVAIRSSVTGGARAVFK
jgi:hypothetical protein